MNLVRALKLGNTVFTRKVIVQQHGAMVSNIIASCRDSLVSYWIKAMTWTLPVATCLHTINLMKHSPFCTQCDQGGNQKESLSYFLSICPHIFSVSVLNFIKLGQQLTIISARFWQLRFISCGRQQLSSMPVGAIEDQAEEQVRQFVALFRAKCRDCAQCAWRCGECSPRKSSCDGSCRPYRSSSRYRRSVSIADSILYAVSCDHLEGTLV